VRWQLRGGGGKIESDRFWRPSVRKQNRMNSEASTSIHSIAGMDSISALDVEIQALKEKVARLEKLRLELQQQYLGKTEDDDLTVVTQSPPEISVQRSGRTINDNVVQYYSLAKFEWSRVLLRMMQKVFEFPSFKPGQEG
jgi:hypothetical protein